MFFCKYANYIDGYTILRRLFEVQKIFSNVKVQVSKLKLPFCTNHYYIYMRP